MNGKSLSPEYRANRRGWVLILLGLGCLWAGSFGAIYELLRFLNPSNFPVGYDPSADYAIIAFCLVLCVLGGLVIWRGFQVRNGRTGERRADKAIDTAMVVMSLMLGLVFCVGTMMLSANTAAAKEVQSYTVPVTRPDYSVPQFPTPVPPQPTPTFDPGAVYQTGMITTSMEGLRAGDVQVRLSADGKTVLAMQVYIYEITCPVAENGSYTTYALPKTNQLLPGPIPVAEDSFYAAAQTNGADAVVHGIVVSPEETRGTLYLRYSDLATKRICDLGTYEWDAKAKPAQ